MDSHFVVNVAFVTDFCNTVACISSRQAELPDIAGGARMTKLPSPFLGLVIVILESTSCLRLITNKLERTNASTFVFFGCV